MEIEEVIKIYDFLGNLDIIGFAALCILLSIGILAVFIPLKEKNILSKKFIIIIVCAVNAALIALYFQAQSKIADLQLANFIKQDLVSTSFKVKSFRNIKLSEKYDRDSAGRIELLKDLSDKFPNELLLVKLSGSYDLDKNGIALIDSKAIEKIDRQIDEKANRTSHLLAALMNTHETDTVFLNFDYKYPKHTTLNNIDGPGWLIGLDFFNALIGRNDLKPVYKNNYIIAFTTLKPLKASSAKPTTSKAKNPK